MIARFRERRSAIEDSLARCGTSVAAGLVRWRLGCEPERPAILVQWDEPWLAFEAAANGASPDGPDAAWLLLRGQGALQANCRYALPPCGGLPCGGLQVVGEVAADGGADLAERCREMVEGLVAARAERPAPHRLTAGAVPERARELVAEVGWPVHERPDGRLAGTLPGVDGAWSAELAGEPGGLRASVEIASMRSAGDATRLALGEMLLAAGHVVRFARAGIEEDGESCAVRFETRLPPDATPPELRHALAALAAACGACAGEVRALQDEALAKEYLLLVRGNAP
jgi:hypothetical protein